MTQNWQELIKISGMISDLELSKLAKAQSDADGIKLEIAELRAMKKTRNQAVCLESEFDISQISGADQKWLLWLDNTIRTKNAKLAEKLAVKEMQTTKARAAFGRTVALKEIVETTKR